MSKKGRSQQHQQSRSLSWLPSGQAGEVQHLKLVDESMRSFTTLYKSERFSDVTLVVGNDTNRIRIPAHRLVLAAHSPYFSAQLFGQMAEARADEVELRVDAVVFEALLSFFYKGTFSIASTQLMEAYNTCGYFQVDVLRERLMRRIMDTISVENACSFLRQAAEYSESHLYDYCLNFIIDGAEHVFHTADFVSLTLDDCRKVFASDCLFVDELLVFNAVVRWWSAQNGHGQLPSAVVASSSARTHAHAQAQVAPSASASISARRSSLDHDRDRDRDPATVLSLSVSSEASSLSELGQTPTLASSALSTSVGSAHAGFGGLAGLAADGDAFAFKQPPATSTSTAALAMSSTTAATSTARSTIASALPVPAFATHTRTRSGHSAAGSATTTATRAAAGSESEGVPRRDSKEKESDRDSKETTATTTTTTTASSSGKQMKSPRIEAKGLGLGLASERKDKDKEKDKDKDNEGAEVLAELLKLVRFELMDPAQLAQHVWPTGLVAQEVLFNAFISIHTHSHGQSQHSSGSKAPRSGSGPLSMAAAQPVSSQSQPHAAPPPPRRRHQTRKLTSTVDPVLGQSIAARAHSHSLSSHSRGLGGPLPGLGLLNKDDRDRDRDRDQRLRDGHMHIHTTLGSLGSTDRVASSSVLSTSLSHATVTRVGAPPPESSLLSAAGPDQDGGMDTDAESESDGDDTDHDEHEHEREHDRDRDREHGQLQDMAMAMHVHRQREQHVHERQRTQSGDRVA